MKIAVAVKQVPASQTIKTDPQTGLLLRDQQSCMMNPYDKPAVELALRIKEQVGGTVTAFTMGPPSAAAVLTEAAAVGVDETVLLTDPAFAGADVFATSLALSNAFTHCGPFDLLLFGRQTTDGDTAQVGPAVAAQLQLPSVSWVVALNQVDSSRIAVTQLLTDREQQVELSLPAVLSVNPAVAQPRLPTLKGKLQANKKVHRKLTAAEIPPPKDLSYGLDGSPTQVERIFVPDTPPLLDPVQGDAVLLVAAFRNQPEIAAVLKMLEVPHG